MLSRLFISRKIFVCLLAMGATTLLGACGGGGDPGDGWNYSPPTGTAPATPIAITTANAQDVASEAYMSYLASNFGTALVGGQTSSPTTPVGVQTSSSSTSSVSLLDVTRKVLEIYNPRQPQIVSGAEVGCEVGSITYPDSGLGIVSFNSCDFGGIVFNGKIKFTGTATATSFNGSLIYNHFTVSESGVVLMSIHGSMNISATYGTPPVEDGSITVSLLATTFGSEVIDLTDYTFSYSIDSSGDQTVTLNYTVSSTLLNGSVTVTTFNPLLYYSGYDYPYAGQIVITGVGDSKVRLTVNPGGTGSIFDFVTIEWDLDDGDDIYDDSVVVDWATLTS